MPVAQPQTTFPAGAGRGPTGGPPRRGLWPAPATAVLIAAVVFAAVFPTLHWEQFHDPIENLNVATAVELRRGGPSGGGASSWLLPHLQGVPRLSKPPLTAWVTAAAIRRATLAALNNPDSVARSAAYDRLAREVRWPALLAACLMLVVVHETGRCLGGDLLGAFAACACGTCWLFLRHCRLATPDIHLALWVAAANFFLTIAVFHRRRWLGCCCAGAALGLAWMTKGPVCLVQGVLPFAAFLLLTRAARIEPTAGRSAGVVIHSWAWPVAAGLALMCAIGLWWYAWVAFRHPGVWSFWMSQVSRVEADEVPAGAWYKHFLSLYLFLPWLAWLAAGAVLAVADWRSGRQRGPARARAASPAILALLLLAVPLGVMSFPKDRFQRYLVPLAPAGALLAAYALAEHFYGRPPGRRWAAAARVAVGAHWLLLGLAAVAGPVAAASGQFPSFQTVAGEPWCTPRTGGLLALGGLAAVVLGAALHRRWRGELVVTTTLVMLAGQAFYSYGRGQSESGRSALRTVADEVWRRYPSATIHVARYPSRNMISIVGNDLSIHLNRPVHWEQNLAHVPAADGPQVWLTARRKDDPELPPPPGWKLLAKIGGGEVKYVFVREPR